MFDKKINWNDHARVQFALQEKTEEGMKKLESLVVPGDKVLTRDGKFTAKVQQFMEHMLTVCTNQACSMVINLSDETEEVKVDAKSFNKRIAWDKAARVRFVTWELNTDRYCIVEIFETEASNVITAKGKFSSSTQECLEHIMATCVDPRYSMTVHLLDGNNGSELNPDGTVKER